MSVSLVAVFIPILLMGGMVGRLFREFAVDPLGRDRDLAGGLADHHADDVRRRCCAARAPRGTAACYRASERVLDGMHAAYRDEPRLGAPPPAH